MQTDLLIYSETFEFHFIESTERFYEKDSSTVSTMTVPAYLDHCLRRLEEENVRLKAYLNPLSRTPLIHVVEKEMIAKLTTNIIEKGFDDLMRQQNIDYLKKLFSLFDRVCTLESVRTAFGQYIKVRLVLSHHLLSS